MKQRRSSRASHGPHETAGARRDTRIQTNYVRVLARSAFRTGDTARRGATRSRICRRVLFHGGHLWSFGVRRSATPFPSVAFAVVAMQLRSRQWVPGRGTTCPCSSTTNEFDGITRHTCLCHVGGDTIKCGKRLSDSLVLALHRALSSLVGPLRLHKAVHRNPYLPQSPRCASRASRS